MKDKDLNHFDSFLDYSNDHEKCIREIEYNIVRVVKDNPGITTFEVYQRERKRMIELRGKVTDGIRSAFTKALGNKLGEEIKAIGTRKIEGRNYVQLDIF